MHRDPGNEPLKVNNEGCSQKQNADDAKPDPAIDEVRIRTKKYPGDERDEFCLAPAIDDICDSERTRDDTDDDTGHDRGSLEALGIPVPIRGSFQLAYEAIDSN